MKRFVAILLLVLAWGAHAQGVLPVPPLTARVIDQTGTLDAIQRQGLEDKLAAFEKEKGTQIAILMVRTTQPEDITSYANRVGNAWKIGRKDVGDGILLVVAKDDRRVRIEVAKTLEGAVPDLAAKQVIDEAITPNFRKGDFAAGLHAAADQLIARIKGEKLPEPASQAQGAQPVEGFSWFDLAIFLFIAIPIVSTVLRGMFGGKLGPIITGAGAGTLAMVVTSSIIVAGIAGVIALIVALMSGGMGGGRRGGMGGPVIFPGGWGGGGGGGGFGGGGFGSGGGGDFGGGGASGDW